MDSDLNSIVWGKWIALACLITAVIVIVNAIRFYSIRRIRQGHGALPGTGWMALPTYTVAETDREGIPEVPAPIYNPNVGESDAGYYDKDGNFIAKARDVSDLAPPQAAAHASNSHQSEEIALQELPQLNGAPADSQRLSPPEYDSVRGDLTEQAPQSQESGPQHNARDITQPSRLP